MELWFCSNNPEAILIRVLRKVKSSKYLLLRLLRNLVPRAFRNVQMLGRPAAPAVTRTRGYASNGEAGLTTQMGVYQRSEQQVFVAFAFFCEKQRKG
ncbi:hypothetical protein AXX12_16455 [Anaerosporomusa subterranea]|uniref:Uncharacterized protein n=1 Tax=Anaerosporomusa subterranea TaxID=1794912 RepID=A0A154BLF9_ANASB|nr:hypothetical protein AXX12_16455 [Anaerosporomusa subterranea]